MGFRVRQNDFLSRSTCFWKGKLEGRSVTCFPRNPLHAMQILCRKRRIAIRTKIISLRIQREECTVYFIIYHLQLSYSLIAFMSHSSPCEQRLAFKAARPMMVIKRFQQPIQMRRSGHDDQNMKDLMGTSPNVKRARRRSFGPASLQMSVSLHL